MMNAYTIIGEVELDVEDVQAFASFSDRLGEAGIKNVELQLTTAYHEAMKQDLSLNDYQRLARTTALYPAIYKILYPALGLAGEAGETANLVKKIARGDYDPKDILTDLEDELGDVLWYVAMLAQDLGLDLERVAKANLLKLSARAKAGTINRSGKTGAMKQSTRLQKNEERHHEYYSTTLKRMMVQYDYRSADGELFSCIAGSLEEARKRRDDWLAKKQSK